MVVAPVRVGAAAAEAVVGLLDQARSGLDPVPGPVGGPVLVGFVVVVVVVAGPVVLADLELALAERVVSGSDVVAVAVGQAACLVPGAALDH